MGANGGCGSGKFGGAGSGAGGNGSKSVASLVQDHLADSALRVLPGVFVLHP